MSFGTSVSESRISFSNRDRNLSAWNEFLDTHTVIDISNIHGAILANCKIMAPVNLAIVIPEPTPFGKDFAREIELKKLTTVGRSWPKVASVDHIKQVVGSDCH